MRTVIYLLDLSMIFITCFVLGCNIARIINGDDISCLYIAILCIPIWYILFTRIIKD